MRAEGPQQSSQTGPLLGLLPSLELVLPTGPGAGGGVPECGRGRLSGVAVARSSWCLNGDCYSPWRVACALVAPVAHLHCDALSSSASLLPTFPPVALGDPSGKCGCHMAVQGSLAPGAPALQGPRASRLCVGGGRRPRGFSQLCRMPRRRPAWRGGPRSPAPPWRVQQPAPDACSAVPACLSQAS